MVRERYTEEDRTGATPDAQLAPVERATDAVSERKSRAQTSDIEERFLAAMSHDLRTPLNAIIGFSGVLLMKIAGPLTPAQEKHLTTIQTSARHLLALVDQMLDLGEQTSDGAYSDHRGRPGES